MALSFRTAVQASQLPKKMGYQQQILLVGSCFTAHMGERLRERKFEVQVNPFGTIYNPVSLARSIWPPLEVKPEDFIFQGGLWRHWDAHSDLAAPTLEDAILKVKSADTSSYLSSADWLVLTLGTADVFAFANAASRIVANCHKMPGAQFRQRRLSIAETVDAISTAIAGIRGANPTLKVLLTVSPVRHMRQGAVANQRSKSVLLLACAELAEQLPDVYYFPAYELLMDDLRDYRFYADDLLHPSSMAIDYIWEQFVASVIAPEDWGLMKKVEKIMAAVNHRPFNADTPETRAFVAKQMAAMDELEAKYAFLSFEVERNRLGAV